MTDTAPPCPIWMRLCLCAGSILAFMALVLGALAAHLPDRFFASIGRAIAQSAVSMQMWHALALLALGLGGRQLGRAGSIVAGGFFAGTLLFCGAVWFTATTGQHPGPIAPTGGVILMISWLVLASLAWRRHEIPRV